MFKKIKDIHLNLKGPHSGFKKKFIIRKYINPKKKLQTFYVDVETDSVQIFAMTPKKKVYLVEQFRPGSDQMEMELPGGAVDPGEDITTAAARELKEETGLTAGELIHLTTVHYSPYSTGRKHLFLALNCKEEFGLDLDDNEFLNVHVMELDEVTKLATSGKLRGTDTFFIGLEFIKSR